MHLDISRDFDASPASVHRRLVDPSLQAAKAAAVGALDHVFEVRDVDGWLEVVSRRRVATHALPEFVKSVVRASMTIVETERWAPPGPDGSREATFALDIDGAPVRLRGAASLRSTTAGCRLTWSGELEATVPLFKARIAESASVAVLETIETEFDLVERALSVTDGD